MLAKKSEDKAQDGPKTDNTLINEQSLLGATRLLLREHGVRKSAAGIRDAVEMPHEVFSPAQAVSALSQLGFKSSFGSIRKSNLREHLFPIIAFDKSGLAYFLQNLQTIKKLL